MRSYRYRFKTKYCTIVYGKIKIKQKLLQLFMKWILIWCNVLCPFIMFYTHSNREVYLSKLYFYFVTIKSIHTKAIKCNITCILSLFSKIYSFTPFCPESKCLRIKSHVSSCQVHQIYMLSYNECLFYLAQYCYVIVFWLYIVILNGCVRSGPKKKLVSVVVAFVVIFLDFLFSISFVTVIINDRLNLNTLNIWTFVCHITNIHNATNGSLIQTVKSIQ